jgi:hypothetical protein
VVGIAMRSGGEGGIRTLGTGVSPYNGLANRRIRPLCHLSDLVRTSVGSENVLAREAEATHSRNSKSTTMESGPVLRGV